MLQQFDWLVGDERAGSLMNSTQIRQLAILGILLLRGLSAVTVRRTRDDLCARFADAVVTAELIA